MLFGNRMVAKKTEIRQFEVRFVKYLCGFLSDAYFKITYFRYIYEILDTWI